MKISLDWLNDYVAIKLAPEALAEGLTLAGLEVKKITSWADGDTVFETEITTNRPDWLSHFGVAREIHAVWGFRLSPVPFKNQIPKKAERSFEVSIPETSRVLCPYYSACLLEEVSWTETPEFMKKRLEACGIRSICLPVDITNYVLLELGQPLHAFDADQLKGGTISARRAHSGESLVAIDGAVYALSENDLVIADEAGPIAIGGVMGGKHSEVSAGARNILLESAFFAPQAVRSTSQRLKLTSESSYRFERRTDPAGVDTARERAIYLFRKYAKVKRISSVFKAGRLPVKTSKISLTFDELEQVLGVQLPQTKPVNYLKRLGLEPSKKGNKIVVRAPSFRADLNQPADLIEEIARLHGYHRIPETLPEIVPSAAKQDAELAVSGEFGDGCIRLGFNEVVTYSLIDPDLLSRLEGSPRDRKYFCLDPEQWVRVLNPRNKEHTLMRPCFLPSILDVVRRNLYAGQNPIKIFELGARYISGGVKTLPNEETMLAIAVSGVTSQNWIEKKRDLTFYDLKGSAEKLLGDLRIEESWNFVEDTALFEAGSAAAVTANGREAGYFGALSESVLNLFDIHQPVFYGEFNVAGLSRCARKEKKFRPLPKFPPSPRDLTLVLNESVRAEAIVSRIRQWGGALISGIELFDYFKGGKIPRGKKSLSFRIIYQASERTLENDEVNRLHFSIVDALAGEFQAELPKPS